MASPHISYVFLHCPADAKFDIKQIRDLLRQYPNSKHIDQSYVLDALSTWNKYAVHERHLRPCTEHSCTLHEQPHFVCFSAQNTFWLRYTCRSFLLSQDVFTNDSANLEKQRRLTISRLRLKIAKTQALIRGLESEYDKLLVSLQ